MPFVTGTLVTCGNAGGHVARNHDAASRYAIAQRLAKVMGYAFSGEYEPAASYTPPVYFVPSDAVPAAAARTLGIRAANDLYGGVVPHLFVGTKVITHPLHRHDARAPAGWSHEFADRVRDVVLRGYAAFSREDARAAAAEILTIGAVRIKCATGIGGSGQHIAANLEAVDAALAAIDERELTEHGVVVEENLSDVATYSVGQVAVRDVTMSYCGMQRVTRNNRGALVYGGSALSVVRGGFASLQALDLPDAARNAIVLAQRYDEAATRSFPGFFASRRNYDVAHGIDAGGRSREGVLEQSWRIGGASGAEIVALEAFRNDASRQQVRASSVELYGSVVAVPAGAFVYFHGDDARVGPLTKYAVANRDADPR
jgi:hypothetical protein